MSDLEALRAELARARWEARHDPLTGVCNRRGLEEYLEEVPPPASVAVIDLDEFRRFNHGSGLMAEGDEALQGLARLLQRRGRTSDLVGRWGGDEFVVVFPGTDTTGATARLRRFLDEARRVLAIGDEIVTFSAGVAALGSSGWRSAFAEANAALEVAKRRGGALVVAAA